MKILCSKCQCHPIRMDELYYDSWEDVPYTTIRYFYEYRIDWLNASNQNMIFICKNCDQESFDEEKFYSDLPIDVDRCLMDAYRYVTHSGAKLKQQNITFNSESFLVFKNDCKYFACKSPKISWIRIHASPIIDKLGNLGGIQVIDFINRQLLPYI